MPLLTLSAQSALRNASDRRASNWPNRKTSNRLEPECRPVLNPGFRITHSDEIFTIGSCFARVIEEALAQTGLSVPMLQFSVPCSEWEFPATWLLNKVTPPAFFQEVELTAQMRSAEPLEFDLLCRKPLLLLDNGQALDLEIAKYLPVSFERAVQRRKEIFAVLSHLFSANVVVLTLGTLECWYDHDTCRYIEQFPAGAELKSLRGRFEFRLLGFSDALDFLKRTIDLIQTVGTPGKHIVITVSPVPLGVTFTGQDVLFANMYSKATLRAVAETVCRSTLDVEYFPSYEIVTLTRSTEFWEDDLIHVTESCVNSIVAQFLRAYVDDAKPAAGA